MRFVPVIRKSETPSRGWPDTTQFFEDFLNDFPIPRLSNNARASIMPTVDILEKDGNLILRADVPGMKEKEIELKLEGNVLTMKGERKLEDEENRDNYHRIESFYGTFSRSFTLPESVDRDKINADYKNGVLTISIPQKPEVKAREIPVAVH
jgi:HSP20 family protein